ncbi:MAG: tRNA (guanosine(37)-N1)-methyltransferase TrmD [Alphaproteobacteria bacterium]
MHLQDPWVCTVLTLFPELYPGPLASSLAGKALERGVWQLDTLNIRDFAQDKHRQVDDICFGGGAGMVLRPDVIDHAVVAACSQAIRTPRLIYLTPRGVPLRQAYVHELVAARDPVVLLCGRYEGVDQRIVDKWEMEEVSIGDYVLSCGDIAALVFIDACVRLLPGVMGKTESLLQESFELDLLEYPQYTRPQVWNDYKVPDVLLSGHHANIEAWRREQAETITRQRRPDLWDLYLERKKNGS